jgi:hypothetical protein
MTTLQTVIPLFPGFTALDGIGPYEVLQRIPSIDVTFIAHQRGEIRSDNEMVGITADGTFSEFPRPDIIVFPAPSSWTSHCTSGCATRTPRPSSPPRSAPVPWSSAPPASSRG